MSEELKARMARMLASPSLQVVPVGDVTRADRGILTAGEGLGNLSRAVKAAFSAVVVATAIAAASPSHAGGVGHDARVYGQDHGQVMRQGAGVRMTVLDVQPVRIEVSQSNGNRNLRDGIAGAGGAIGAIAGSQMAKTYSGKQVGAIVGGIVGAFGANLLNNAVLGASMEQVDGAEITMLNPATNQVVVIAQAGAQQFSPDDAVLVVTMGGTSRVIPDRGRAVAAEVHAERGMAPLPALQGAKLEQTVEAVTRSAGRLGLQVDANQVATMLETGVGRDGTYVGKIAGIDTARGVVFQGTGRGMGIVHPLSALDRVPVVGEVATIRMQDGQGTFMGRGGQSLAMGQGR